MKLFVLVPSVIAIAAVAGCTQDGLVDFDAAMALIEETADIKPLEEKPEGKAEMSGFLGFGLSPEMEKRTKEPGEDVFAPPEELHIGRANVTADFDANTLDGTASGFKTYGVESPDGCESQSCLLGTELASLGGTLDIEGSIKSEDELYFSWFALGSLTGDVSGVTDPDLDLEGSGDFYSVDGKLTAVGGGSGSIRSEGDEGKRIGGFLAVQE